MISTKVGNMLLHADAIIGVVMNVLNDSTI
jgi:hypothetical protein